MKRVSIGIMASGGGHTGYGKAIGEALKDLVPEINIIYYVPRGDKWTLERIKPLLFNGSSIEYILKPREPYDPLYRFLFKTPVSMVEALAKVHNLLLLVATGSNHSLFAGLAAMAKRIPVLNIEAADRIIYPSKTPRILYRLGAITLLHWREQKKLYPRGIVVGPIYEKPRYKPTSRGYILVTTGTMGHKILFDKLLETGIENIVLQTGRIPPEKYRDKKPGWIVFSFDPDIDKWIAGAEVVVTHQGITALNAALSYGKPVVIAYNPLLKKSSSREDAIVLARKLNAVFIDPLKTSSRELEEAILKARDMKPRRYRNGAYVIARHIIKILLSL